MNENHQDKVESEVIITENEHSIPPLTSTDPENLEQIWKKQREKSGGWTGFSGKTLWDWLRVLLQILGIIAIPLAIIIGTASFNSQQNQTAAQITASQQQEACLQAYLDRMSDLLFNHNLRKSRPGDEVNQIAKEQTLTTLRRLRSDRNIILIQFLQDAHLISGKNAVIDLSGTNLDNDDLYNTNLSGVNLSGASLYNTELNSADLSGTNLSSANLKDADLSNAIMRGIDLSGANLGSAILIGANLSDANLNGAIATQDQLNSSATLHNAIMPDGSRHL